MQLPLHPFTRQGRQIHGAAQGHRLLRHGEAEAGSELRDRLWANARQFREQMSAAGFTLAGADHAIIPVMLGDAVVAQKFARELQKEGIYVTGFFYPVVPKGQARIRTQMSAAHTPEQITRAVEAFTRIGKQLGVIA